MLGENKNQQGKRFAARTVRKKILQIYTEDLKTVEDCFFHFVSTNHFGFHENHGIIKEVIAFPNDKMIPNENAFRR